MLQINLFDGFNRYSDKVDEVCFTILCKHINLTELARSCGLSSSELRRILDLKYIPRADVFFRILSAVDKFPIR